ncbi:MAG: succinic semialdehyde dehydrogenase, partial [Streptomycetales bacterium]
AYAAAWASVAGPMGGMGESGVSRRHGAEGIHKYTEPQTIAIQRMMDIAPAFGLSERGWAGFLTRYLRLMKRLGVR